MLVFETVVFLVTGAALAGLVMGLVGFGTGLAALGFWLFVVDPILAVPLVSICSLATTAFTLRAYSHAISWTRLAPFFAGAAAGLPLGILLLARLDPAIFKIAMGVFSSVTRCFACSSCQNSRSHALAAPEMRLSALAAASWAALPPFPIRLRAF